MPWDGTSLKIAKLDSQSLSLSEVQTLDGFGEYACYQASFSPCGNFLAWLANTGEFDDLIVYDLRTKSKLTFISQKVSCNRPGLQGNTRSPGRQTALPFTISITTWAL